MSWHHSYCGHTVIEHQSLNACPTTSKKTTENARRHGVVENNQVGWLRLVRLVIVRLVIAHAAGQEQTQKEKQANHDHDKR